MEKPVSEKMLVFLVGIAVFAFISGFYIVTSASPDVIPFKDIDDFDALLWEIGFGVMITFIVWVYAHQDKSRRHIRNKKSLIALFELLSKGYANSPSPNFVRQKNFTLVQIANFATQFENDCNSIVVKFIHFTAIFAEGVDDKNDSQYNVLTSDFDLIQRYLKNPSQQLVDKMQSIMS